MRRLCAAFCVLGAAMCPAVAPGQEACPSASFAGAGCVVAGNGTFAAGSAVSPGCAVTAFECFAACIAHGAATTQPAPFAAVTFSNGDCVRARIVEVARGQARLALEIAPDQLVTVDVARISLIEIANAAEGEGEVVELRDGTRLVGKSLRFENGSMLLDLREGGRLAIPLHRLQLYRRPQSPLPEEASTNKNSVVIDNGDVLVGDISVTPDGSLAIKGTVNVTVAHRQVAGIYPPPSAAPQAEDANDAAASDPAGKGVSVVALTYGAVLAGSDLAVARGELSLTLPIGRRITVPLRSVLRMEPAQSAAAISGTGLRNVLAWGPWSDRDQEFPWTVSALKDKLPAGWKVHEDFSTSFDRDFQRRLATCRTLLIPELENWGSDPRAELAKALKPLAERFLRAGGNIVICGAAEGPLAFLKEAGILDATKSGQSNTDAVNFTAPGKKLSAKVGNSFTVCNSTYFYRLAGKGESWAEGAQGSAILARRVGRGYVILMGMDYYTRTDALNQLLANAALLK